MKIDGKRGLAGTRASEGESAEISKRSLKALDLLSKLMGYDSAFNIFAHFGIDQNFVVFFQ